MILPSLLNPLTNRTSKSKPSSNARPTRAVSMLCSNIASNMHHDKKKHSFPGKPTVSTHRVIHKLFTGAPSRVIHKISAELFTISTVIYLALKRREKSVGSFAKRSLALVFGVFRSPPLGEGTSWSELIITSVESRSAMDKLAEFLSNYLPLYRPDASNRLEKSRKELSRTPRLAKRSRWELLGALRPPLGRRTLHFSRRLPPGHPTAQSQ